VFAEDEARLLVAEARSELELDAMVEKRVAGVPLEHVLGWAELYGRRVTVEPGVFVPRRRTELLVDHAIALAHQTVREPGDADEGRPIVVVELCCGSGAIGAVLASAVHPVEVHAVDIDPAAVRCARRNLASAAGDVYQGDLYEPLPAALPGRVDLLIANAPYVPTEDLDLLPGEARRHEPRVALDGGRDGLDVLRRVITAAPRWLAPGGHLLVETSEQQAPHAAQAVTDAGLVARTVTSDDLGATVVIGVRG
jgi:release factor glutamine methyltransferase